MVSRTDRNRFIQKWSWSLMTPFPSDPPLIPSVNFYLFAVPLALCSPPFGSLPPGSLPFCWSADTCFGPHNSQSEVFSISALSCWPHALCLMTTCGQGVPLTVQALSCSRGLVGAPGVQAVTEGFKYCLPRFSPFPAASLMMFITI